MELIQLLSLTISVSLVYIQPWLSIEALVDDVGQQARLLSASEFKIYSYARMHAIDHV